ncbi:oligopeptide ABC transporter substrate-binding protein [Ligilactobacillus salitolerans]|uniref:Oligopeptide ABC transporter substrate-binding protein n=1 Tax=Ligilactobacillus salitolerans TaxID=1808352 RepID=A0A401IPZ6_9LACO|nr:peptide ABC transporter substrate-binding protein [Ligilactobacillus salitolerans]GBG93609.1 oligopeptide ABC transporter substrate-binding protein [Ligilactobacillus salitolerans]
MNKYLMRLGKITLTAAAVLALAACGKNNQQNSAATDKNVLNLSTPSEISIMDPSKAEESVALTQLYHTGEGLYRLGKNNKLENALATSSKVSSDGLTYTFKLRSDDKWSDGSPVTAQDFVYAWRRTADPKTAAGYSYLFEGVKNFSAIQKKQAQPDQLGVKAVGKNQLVVTLDKPVPYFKELLAFPTFFPQQEKSVQKFGKDYGTSSAKMTANGPFKLTKWKGTNEKWTLVKNPNYWDQKNVHLKKINLRVLKSPSTGYDLYQQKKLDVTTLDGSHVANLKNRKDYQVYTGGSMTYMHLNQQKVKALQNLKIRRALSQAIDRKKLADKVLHDGSTVPKGFVSTNFYRNPKTNADFANDAYVKDGVSYNKKNAQKLWTQGMKEVGQKKLHLTVLGDDTDASKKVTEYIQSSLSELPGLTVSVNNVPKLNRMSRADSGDFDLVVASWGADFADPINFLDLLTSDSSSNSGKWHNDQYDKLIERSGAADANNKQQRYQDLVDAEKILMQEQGVIPLYQPATAQLWRTNISGYVWNPAGMSQGWKEIKVK